MFFYPENLKILQSTVISMDFGSILDDSFAYAKEGVWERWSRWLVLIGCMIIFPLILGYIVRIYRGERPAPEPGEWATLFVDGLKLLVVHIVYWAPVFLLILVAFIPFILTLVSAGVFSESFSAMSDTQTERWFDSHPELLSQLLVTGGFMVSAHSHCHNSRNWYHNFLISRRCPVCPHPQYQ